MTALGKLFRTTAFKLTLVYLLIFSIFAAFLLAYFAWNTRRLITQQITETVDAEITGLAEQYRQGGIRRLVLVIDSRSRRPGSSLYLLTTTTGQALAGNVGSLAQGVLNTPGWAETEYRRIGESDAASHPALVRVFQLPSGFRLLVGRDLEERERLYGIVLAAGRWSIALVVVLGLAGGFFVTRRVLARVDAMSESTRTIMTGDFSGRLPIAGTGDELDRLAGNLNAMLERIEALMHGLKEVSDNIAHDLKTPLTRLRNRCEEALRSNRSDTDYRTTLEATIEESDALIRTFNALLMIARAESGQAREDMQDFDAAEVARDIADLYEPLADEKGLTLAVDAESAALVHGNRELVSQALANLLDNAIKYTGPRHSAPREPEAAEAVAELGRVQHGGDQQAAAQVDGAQVNGAQVNGAQVNGAQMNAIDSDIVVKATNQNDRIVLAVSDHGPGIPVSDRGRVVERFVRLEQSRSQPGSGLGLSLASAVARLHGGELWLEDNHPGLSAMIALPRTSTVQDRT